MAAERKIGGNVYRCDKLPASEGLRMLMRVMAFFKLAPDMVGTIVAGAGNGKAAFMTVCLSDEVNADETQQLMHDLVGLCRVGADPCVVGVKPADLAEVIDVAWFAMEVNFRDFLAASLA